MGVGKGNHTGVQCQDVVHSVEQSSSVLRRAGTRLLQGGVDQLHQLTDGGAEEWEDLHFNMLSDCFCPPSLSTPLDSLHTSLFITFPFSKIQGHKSITKFSALPALTAPWAG